MYAGPQVVGRSLGLSGCGRWRVGLIGSTEVLHRSLGLQQTLLVVRPARLQLHRHVTNRNEFARRR
eukprot:scaffold269862_cov13-Prasinocladus_malaysianus.AAC.1